MSLSVNPTDDDALIASIATIVQDYRSDDGVVMGEDAILRWVQQFEARDQGHVLRETHAVLSKRYVSQQDAIDFLAIILPALADAHTGGDLQRFLATTQFLDLQPAGKSQRALLDLLEPFVASHGFSVASCGGEAPARYVYLDDVLCTGNTVFFDMQAWWLAPDPATGTPRHTALDRSVTVDFVFIVVHARNIQKLKSRCRYDPVLKGRAWPRAVWSAIEVENTPDDGAAALDVALPRRDGLSAAAEAYFVGLDCLPSDVVRRDNAPKSEALFTSPEGRDRFERAILDQGLHIINGLASHKENMRPLGFTLPSHKSFGFGALAFTWRNVPNNSPLVFWHDAQFWTPLFRKRNAPAIFDVVDTWDVG